MDKYTVGNFTVNLPDYMSKTGGINNAATIQYQSVVKDVYGFVILDTKEELSLVEMNFGSVNEFETPGNIPSNNVFRRYFIF